MGEKKGKETEQNAAKNVIIMEGWKIKRNKRTKVRSNRQKIQAEVKADKR